MDAATNRSGRQETIAQPVVRGLAVAPESKRVDLASPKFSAPTDVSNPLFPVSEQESVLLVGRVDGKAFRTEVTLLPETRIIEWQGEQVETLVSQYVAYLDGRIHEVAYDFYAQDDDGAVWYFGEDVFNFKDGAIADTHGTWIAGKDGPAAMIMPAEPKVGDVYRPENIPGFVFEEVTVKAVDQTLDGPLGIVEGGLVIEELHMDNAKERKIFAPGYGEFFTAGGGDVEALALAVPTDALADPAPRSSSRSRMVQPSSLQRPSRKDWIEAETMARRMTAPGPLCEQEMSRAVEPPMSDAIEALTGVSRVAMRSGPPGRARRRPMEPRSSASPPARRTDRPRPHGPLGGSAARRRGGG